MPLRHRGFESPPLRSSLRTHGTSATVPQPERCPSGRRGTLGKRVYPTRYRGFESLPLRSIALRGAMKVDTLACVDAGRWRLGPAQEGVANPVRSGRKQRYRMSVCAAGHPSRHRQASPPRTSHARMTYQVLARRLTAATFRRRRRPGARDAHAPDRDRARGASRTRSSSPGRAASARPRPRASSPRRSTARRDRPPSPATPAPPAARSPTASAFDVLEIDGASHTRSTRCAT